MTQPNQLYAVPLSGLPISIDPNGLNDNPRTLLNLGTVTVYATDLNAPRNGIPISPGNPIVWGGRRPLYVYSTSSTVAGSVLLIDSADPISAANISVAPSAGSAFVFNPAPPIGLAINSWSPDPINVAGFSTLDIVMEGLGSAVQNYTTMTITWYVSLSGAVAGLAIGSDTFVVGGLDTNAFITLPVAAAYMRVGLSTSFGNGLARLSFYGSYLTKPRRFVSDAAAGALSGSAFAVLISGIAVSATARVFLPSIAGFASYYLRCGTVFTSGGMFCRFSNDFNTVRGPLDIRFSPGGPDQVMQGTWVAPEQSMNFLYQNLTNAIQDLELVVNYQNT